ncbi:MAG: phage portal protein [Rhodocyclaceae bacterium]|nr:phage portal protein [Rhodocyclaceae bacterium]
MKQAANWYNKERVSQSGSVILNAWREQRQALRNDNAITTNKTLQELSDMYGWQTSYAGVAVNESTAMAVSAVYACVALIGGAIASCSLPIYERTTDNRKRVDHPVWWLLNERPNPNMSAATMYEYIAASILLHGDAFVEIQRRPNSAEIRGLWPYHPSRVEVTQSSIDRQLYYRITDENGNQRTLSGIDMLHFPSVGFDGKRSMSVVQHAARQGIGTALAAEEYSARFFGNGARPDMVLKAEGKLSDESIKTLRTTWAQRHQGASNSHLPAILTGGLSLEKITMTSEDAQLIATRGFQVEDICRFFGVPPHMIGHTEKTSSWGSGVENMGRGFVKFALSRHLGKIEQEINYKFWPLRERFFAEFNVAALERGDLKSENEALRVALGRAGEDAWMTINEVRKIKNLPPIDGGDDIKKATALPAPSDPAEPDPLPA